MLPVDGQGVDTRYFAGLRRIMPEPGDCALNGIACAGQDAWPITANRRRPIHGQTIVTGGGGEQCGAGGLAGADIDPAGHRRGPVAVMVAMYLLPAAGARRDADACGGWFIGPVCRNALACRPACGD